MKWVLPFVLLLNAGRCLAAEPYARVEIEDKGKIVAGQQIRLDVTVFAPDFFTSPPQFPLFDLQNAMVTLPDERAQNLVETVDGVQYSGIRRAYAIVPETSGDYSLPSVVIDLGYSVEGKAVKGRAIVPSLGFTVQEAGGSNVNTLAFAARDLTLEQTFDRDPTSLKVGDALVRTITVFAEATQAMMIPAVDVGSADGIKQYSATSRIDDNVSVGRQTGSRRIQTITYTVDTAGSFVIPGIAYVWHDVGTDKQATATLDATKLTVAAMTSPGDGIAPVVQTEAQDRFRWPLKSTVAFAVVFLCAWLGWTLRLPVTRTFGTLILAYRNSDRVVLKKLKTTIRTKSARDIEIGLRNWAYRKGFRTLPDWAASDPALVTQVERLQACLYEVDGRGQPTVDRVALENALAAASAEMPLRSARRPSLPALNPDGRGDVTSGEPVAGLVSTGHGPAHPGARQRNLRWRLP